MGTSNFRVNMLNTLKNDRRLEILEIISKSQQSIEKIQQELKSHGYNHSQRTIIQEYLAPLVEAEMAEDDQNKYCATLFGYRISELAKDLRGVESLLPPHSECYEETALDLLLNESRTYKEFKNALPAKSIARVLHRLQKSELVETTKENDYVFYFRTKRDAGLAKLSPTEKRVYENISTEGISARKLCEKIRISLRRTYKYIRRLKGKKLVFARQKPKAYALTTKGFQIASTLKRINDLMIESTEAAAQAVNKNDANTLTMLDAHQNVESKRKKVAPLPTIQ